MLERIILTLSAMNNNVKQIIIKNCFNKRCFLGSNVDLRTVSENVQDQVISEENNTVF